MTLDTGIHIVELVPTLILLWKGLRALKRFADTVEDLREALRSFPLHKHEANGSIIYSAGVRAWERR